MVGVEPTDQEALIDLYDRLMLHFLDHDRPSEGEAMAVSIHDAVLIAQLIEERLGPNWFYDE